MTREEAIKIIDTGKNFAYDEKYIEAFDMAIEALKQVPYGDCISREYLLSKRYGYDPHYCPTFGLEPTGWAVDIEDILNAPSVKPKEKYGKWILVHPLQDDIEGGYMCSECGTGYYDNSHWNFCPNCGAKMKVRISND